MQRFLFIVIVCLFASCEKDLVLTQDIEAGNLADYLARVNPEKTSNTLWAHAGNHPFFERTIDEQTVHIRMHLPDEYSNVQLFISDSINYPDSLKLFSRIDKDVLHKNGDLFGLFAIKETQDNRSRLAIVSIESSDSTYLSSPILLRANNKATNTKNTSGISIETTPGGRAYVNWNGAGIDEPWKNLVELRDQTGAVFCAVETNNLSFLFHDLRNVTRNFKPELRDPRLIEGQVYSITIYRNDNQGWMRNYRLLEFEADSRRIQEFD